MRASPRRSEPDEPKSLHRIYPTIHGVAYDIIAKVLVSKRSSGTPDEFSVSHIHTTLQRSMKNVGSRNFSNWKPRVCFGRSPCFHQKCLARPAAVHNRRRATDLSESSPLIITLQ